MYICTSHLIFGFNHGDHSCSRRSGPVFKFAAPSVHRQHVDPRRPTTLACSLENRQLHLEIFDCQPVLTNRSANRYAHDPLPLRNRRRDTNRTVDNRSNGDQAQPADPEEPFPQGLVCDTPYSLLHRCADNHRQRYVRVHFDQVIPLSPR
jgi:hypothetical protein